MLRICAQSNNVWCMHKYVAIVSQLKLKLLIVAIHCLFTSVTQQVIISACDFEAKHSYFKSLAHRVKCFKDIAKTLAHRHQTMICYYLAGNPEKFCKEITIGRIRYMQTH